MEYITHSSAETEALGLEFGRQLAVNSVVCFYGDLGAGKTTFIKGLAEGVLGISAEAVNSPTFTYLNIYRGNKTLYHFDLYRLRGVDDFLDLGFDEVLEAGGVCCIEWAERLDPQIIPHALKVEIKHLGADRRAIHIYKDANG